MKSNRPELMILNINVKMYAIKSFFKNKAKIIHAQKSASMLNFQNIFYFLQFMDFLVRLVGNVMSPCICNVVSNFLLTTGRF